MANLGIPYMGSKQRLSKKIVDVILNNNPKCKYVYDLFGGGGSISFEFLKRPQIKKVIYNELNTGVCELLRKIQKEGVTDEFYRWISREDFFKHKDDNDWFGGLLKTCWSFGNNHQKGYMFGKNIEEPKRLLHEVVVNKELDCLEKFNKHFNLSLDISSMNQETINERRLELQRIMTRQVKDKSVLKGFCVNEENSVRHILQQLERLEQLQKLEQLQQLEISNKSFENVKITTPIEETIIYLDPPYKNTAGYQCEVDFDFLYEFIEKSPYKIYISEYDLPFTEVASFDHRSILSSNGFSKTTEKLYCNKQVDKNKKEVENTLFNFAID